MAKLDQAKAMLKRGAISKAQYDKIVGTKAAPVAAKVAPSVESSDGGTSATNANESDGASVDKFYKG